MLKLLNGFSHFPMMAEEGDQGGGGDGGQSNQGDQGQGDNAGNKDSQQGSGESLLEDINAGEGDQGESQPLDFTKGKPEGFPDDAWDDKTKTPKADILYNKLQAAEKMAKDLRAKMGKGDHKAPKEEKEYTFTPDAKYKSMAPDNDPIVAAGRKIALKHGMSKEMFSSFMGDMTNEIGALVENLKNEPPKELTEEEKTEIKKAEYAKIGTNAVGIIKSVESWGRELKNTGQLSESELETFKGMAVTGDQVRVLNKLRAIAGGGNSIPMDAGNDGLPSDQEIAELQANVKTQADQDKVDKLYEQRRRAGRPEKLQIKA